MIIASWKKNLYVEKGNTFKYDNGEWFIYEKKYDQTTNNKTVDDGKNHTNINTIIPINLNLTIDGIGGIYYGNRIQVDYLPENYKNRDIKFQITNVQHTIENNNWKTSLETLMRVL
jgi:hypothetical protein